MTHAPLRVFGAGMAGLLTAQMLRRRSPVLFEAQPSLPDNHGALLRFRSTAVTEATGLPLRRVSIQKAIKREDATMSSSSSLRDANAYSRKVTGQIIGRSVLDLSPGERYVAPPDFLPALASGLSISYNEPLRKEHLDERHRDSAPIISTIPMPVLMRMAGWKLPDFQWLPIYSSRTFINDPPVDIYQTIYYPYEEQPYYRASITGRQLILEYPGRRGDPSPEPRDFDKYADMAAVLSDFGIENATLGPVINVKRQEYGKLIPLDNDERQTFILSMTDEKRIYSVGRFATWRQILMDDVVADVRYIEKLLTQRSTYERRLTETHNNAR
jgi:hypothetical protein